MALRRLGWIACLVFPSTTLATSTTDTLEATGTGGCKPHTWDSSEYADIAEKGDDMTDDKEDFNDGFPKITFQREKKNLPESASKINCRMWTHTLDNVGPATCRQIADKYTIPLDRFLAINPDIDERCSNIQPYTEYCAAGWPEPIVNEDETCGPYHGNGTCWSTNKPCCNSETWKCGDQIEDCANGVCYSGICPGHSVYAIDGKCGIQNANRLCAGKWGDCCDFKGDCGTGDAYCGEGRCQSGNCEIPIGPLAMVSMEKWIEIMSSTSKLHEADPDAEEYVVVPLHDREL